MRLARLTPRLTLALALLASGISSLSPIPAQAATNPKPAAPQAAKPKPAAAKASKAKPAAKPAPPPAPRVEPPPPEALARLAASSNAFGFDLYQRLRGTPGNLLFSPASITTALTMAWGGAQGETAAQMQRVLHLEGTPAELLPVSGALLRTLQVSDPSKHVSFRVANQLFAEKSYKLQADYLGRIDAAFGAPLEQLDFKQAPERSRARINAWVEGKTERRIRDLIPPQGVSSETRLALVNAIYFLGDWQIPFEKDETRPALFHLSEEKDIQVPTLHRTGGFSIGQADGVTALAIPYSGGTLSMLFLVPDEVAGLAAFEAKLDEPRLRRLLATMGKEYVSAGLPKFEVRPTQSLSLGQDLEEMGMALAFNRDKADFRGIADPPSPPDRVVLAKVFHKGFLRVDEEGTEAAAATMVMGVMGGAAGGGAPQPRIFRADRPFLFLLRDNASGLILFLGRVSDPSAN